MMKTKILSMLWLWLACASQSLAADVVTVKAVTVEPGGTATVAIDLDNETTNLMGWQCDISLPEGMALKLKKNGKPDAKLSDRFSDTGHSISTNVVAGGYRFLATSLDAEAIPETSGTLFTVTLTCDASVTPGVTYKGTVADIKLNTIDNRKIVLDDIQFDIVVPGNTPLPATVVTPPTAKELTYNGKAQELVNAGTAQGGTMQYSLDGQSFSTAIPTATEAKTYTIYYKVVASEGYTDTEAETISVTIGKAAATVVTPPTAKELTYNGKAQELVNAGKAQGGTLQYSLDGESFSTAIPTATEAKTYTVYYKVVASEGYTDTQAETISVTIKAPDTLKGDVNMDGHIDVGDIMGIINIMAGQPGQLNVTAADVNDDGSIDVGDIMGIINIMAAQ